MSEDLRQPELNALEAALTALKPALGGLDREQLMFRAGQESMRRPQRFWPGVSAALMVAVVVLGGLLASRPTVVQMVHVPVELSEPLALARQESTGAEAPTLPRLQPSEPLLVRGDYLRLREEMLSGKVSQAVAAPTYHAPSTFTLEQMLELPAESLDPVSRSRLQRAFPQIGEPL